MPRPLAAMRRQAYLRRNKDDSIASVRTRASQQLASFQVGAGIGTAIAERIRRRMESLHFSHSTRPFGIVASIGLAMIDGTAPEKDVMAFADSACYSAKIQGGARVEVYDDNDSSMANLRLMAPRAVEIKEAVRTGAFKILFQPIVDVQTTEPVHYEVLLRLANDQTLIPPGAFISTAERFRIMPEIDRHVIKMALPFLVKNRSLRLAINLSGQSFGDQTLPDFIDSAFKDAGVEPGRVTFEITETALISNMPTAREAMHHLRTAGFGFALDDFGAWLFLLQLFEGFHSRLPQN